MTTKVDERLQELLSSNREFAKTWHNPASMNDMRASAKESGEAVLILTCLDPRCVPEQYFGPSLRTGVIRNAGGRATPDAIRSILALRTLADARAVFVVHHTDCGMTHMTDAEIAADAKARNPAAAGEVEEMVREGGGFGCFEKERFEEAIREDVRVLRGKEVLRGLEIRGLGFELEDGVVRVVE